MTQLNRLGINAPAELSKPLVDRARPISFTVDGMRIAGFAGDTVLSALLANGVVSAGMQNGYAVALDAQSAPPVVAGDAQAEMPMALCPALDGLAYRTVGARRTMAPIRALFTRKAQSLSLDLDVRQAPGRWIEQQPDQTLQTDILVIGGGVAGMSAALKAARDGARVTLIEREAVLGGMAVFFGKADGETPPEERIAELEAAIIETADTITVLRGTDVFDLSGNTARAVRVSVQNGLPQPETLQIFAGGIVLATGAEDRMPIYPGNRLPNVVRADFVWRMARHYAVWPGQSFHLHTATNAGYRLAMLGAEAGKTIVRTSDPRPDPRTRFIEFCKAYGFRLGWGTSIAEVSQGKDGLAIGLTGHQIIEQNNAPIIADALIVSGGWQPALSPWMLAGGEVEWDTARGRLVTATPLADVVIAGSAAGLEGSAGCVESGKAAVGELRDGKAGVIADPRIDEAYESRDGAFGVSEPLRRGQAPAWTSPDRKFSLPEPPLSGLAAFFLRQPKAAAEPIASQSLADISGALASGRLAMQDAAAFSAQWHILPTRFKAEPLPHIEQVASPALPSYLVGRFGPAQALWHLALDEDRTFDPGCMIFINTDETHYANAIGVIVSSTDERCTALMARTAFGASDVVYVRDGATCVPARLLEKIKPLDA